MENRPVLAVLGLLLAAIFSGVRTQPEPECSEGDVEFLGLSVSYAGIVRVCVNGVWGTVCAGQNTPWSEKNCQVACRKAGYSGAVNPILQSTLPPYVKNEVANDMIHYSSVICDGTETELSDCFFSENTNACNHDYDAAVTCKADIDNSGDVRLLGSEADGKGVVEFYDSSYGWTGVCVTDIIRWLDATATATIVCRQLGYEGGTTYIELESNIVNAVTSLDVRDLSCDSSDFFLTDCDWTPAGTACSVAGGVECSVTSSDDYSVRLVGGCGTSERYSGVVEVLFNGRWGTICGSGWSVEAATVVCRQLGLLTDDTPPSITGVCSDSDYSQSVNPSWLSMVLCGGTESSLSECSYSPPVGYTACSNTVNYAVVRCADPAQDGGGLSGGAIAGIVIGSLVGIGCLIALIHMWSESEKKKKAAAAARRQSHPAPAPVPVPTITPVLESGQQNTATTPPTVANQEAEEPSRPEAELMNMAPPSYQAAMTYPTASTQQPPFYPEKPPPQPDFSAAYPPTAPPAPLLGPGYPYPPPTHHPAYPPPGVSPHPAYPPPVGETVFVSPYPQ